MHVIVRPCGRIRHVGPTIHKLRHRGTWIGSNFFDQFVMRRP
ncbi:MAG TPA: GGDEF domain-containing protein, partial [Sulfitobacter sp.]|nr:GGDEF domain-containing protein [Sulfitobacter sp.]